MLLIEYLGTNFSEILIDIQTYSFKEIWIEASQWLGAMFMLQHYLLIGGNEGIAMSENRALYHNMERINSL